MNETCWLVAIVFLYLISILVGIIVVNFVIDFVVVVKFQNWQKSTKMFILIQIQIGGYIMRMKQHMYMYHSILFHPYHVCKAITYVVLMLWLLLLFFFSFFFFSLSNGRKLFSMQEDHCQDPYAIPLTQEEISNLVFKKKSGIIKGLGMRPSSSLVTTVSSSSSVEYIHRL